MAMFPIKLINYLFNNIYIKIIKYNEDIINIILNSFTKCSYTHNIDNNDKKNEIINHIKNKRKLLMLKEVFKKWKSYKNTNTPEGGSNVLPGKCDDSAAGVIANLECHGHSKYGNEWPFAEYYSQNKIIKKIKEILKKKNIKIDEPINTLSSYTMSIISMYYIIQYNINKNKTGENINSLILYFTVFLCGIASGLAHSYVFNDFFINLDKLSMFLPVFYIYLIQIYYPYNVMILLINILIYYKKNYNKLYKKINEYIFYKKENKNEDYFNVHFGVNVIILIIILLMKKKYNLINIIILLFAIFFRQIDSIKFPFGHGMWHILMSIATLKIIKEAEIGIN
tara:strand:+ start:2285 stop:3301 length:1017 start_codon:yes stop_codon:yes gene_type:complete